VADAAFPCSHWSKPVAWSWRISLRVLVYIRRSTWWAWHSWSGLNTTAALRQASNSCELIRATVPSCPSGVCRSTFRSGNLRLLSFCLLTVLTLLCLRTGRGISLWNSPFRSVQLDARQVGFIEKDGQWYVLKICHIHLAHILSCAHFCFLLHYVVTIHQHYRQTDRCHAFSYVSYVTWFCVWSVCCMRQPCKFQNLCICLIGLWDGEFVTNRNGLFRLK